VPFGSFYTRDGLDAPTPSEALVASLLASSESHPSQWRHANLRSVYALRDVKQVLAVAKNTMHDKTNPYLR